MVDEALKSEKAPAQLRSWCVEWFGSEGDFLAGGKREPDFLGPPFRSGKPVRGWLLGTATAAKCPFSTVCPLSPRSGTRPNQSTATVSTERNF